MSNRLYRLGRWAVGRRRLVLGAWLLVLLGVGILGSQLGGKAVDDFNVPGTESQAGRDLLAAKLPGEGSRAQVVFRSPAGTSITDPAVASTVSAYLDSLNDQPNVTGVSRLIPAPEPGQSRIGLAFVTYDSRGGMLGVEPGKRLMASAEALRAKGLEVEFGGEISIGEQKIGGGAELVGLGVAVIVLLVAFGSVVAMGLPLATALIGLGTGLGLVTVAEKFLSVPTVAPTLAAMIGLGVGIDYALFIVTRHREHLHRGMTVKSRPPGRSPLPVMPWSSPVSPWSLPSPGCSSLASIRLHSWATPLLRR